MNKNNKIINIKLDEPVIRRVAVVENERTQAIRDLLEDNFFEPVIDINGPFVFVLKMDASGHTIIARVLDAEENDLYKFNISLRPLRRIIKDYFHICESYYDAIKFRTAQQIETIDMARRALHDESADILLNIMSSNVNVDKQTARRLFTLIIVMHIRG